MIKDTCSEVVFCRNNRLYQQIEDDGKECLWPPVPNIITN